MGNKTNEQQMRLTNCVNESQVPNEGCQTIGLEPAIRTRMGHKNAVVQQAEQVNM